MKQFCDWGFATLLWGSGGLFDLNFLIQERILTKDANFELQLAGPTRGLSTSALTSLVPRAELTGSAR